MPSSSLPGGEPKVGDSAMLRVRARYWLGGMALVGFVALGISALEQTSVHYASIAEAIQSGRRVQVKGTWVREVEPAYDARTNTFRFVLQDEAGTRIPVVYAGAKPNNFELAESVVVRGKVENGEFRATDILTKCPSKYEGGSPIPQ